jgi:hypothetical protein
MALIRSVPENPSSGNVIATSLGILDLLRLIRFLGPKMIKSLLLS